MNSGQDLRHQVIKAFSSQERPEILTTSTGYHEEEDLQDALKNIDWLQAFEDPKWFFDVVVQNGDVAQLLSPQGFRYFTPAFLSALLERSFELYGYTSGFFFRFCSPSSTELWKEDAERYYIDTLAEFTPNQLSAVHSVLVFHARTMRPDGDFSSLHKYLKIAIEDLRKAVGTSQEGACET